MKEHRSSNSHSHANRLSTGLSCEITVTMDRDQPVHVEELYEPESRFLHISCSSDGQVIVWGGQTSEFYSSDGWIKLVSVVEQFDPCTELECGVNSKQEDCRTLDCLALPARRLEILCLFMEDMLVQYQALVEY